MGSVSTQIEAMDVCCGCVWRRGAASCCCLFLLLFVANSLACTHNDRGEWIVFCCWHFGGRAGSLTFFSRTIHSVSKIVCPSDCLIVCLLFTSLHFLLEILFLILSDKETTPTRSLSRDRTGNGSNHEQATTLEQSKRATRENKRANPRKRTSRQVLR